MLGKLKLTGSNSQGLVMSDLYIIRVGRQPLVAGVSVYLPMCICETKTRFLVETGAEITMISQKLFERTPRKLG